MVQFPQSRFRQLFIHSRIPGSRPVGYPIRLPADLRMCAPPRRFSQLAAAFLASIRQGIHLKPFSRLTILSFRQKTARQFLSMELSARPLACKNSGSKNPSGLLQAKLPRSLAAFPRSEATPLSKITGTLVPGTEVPIQNNNTIHFF